MTDVNFDEIFKYILLFRKESEVVGLNERLRWILWNGKLSWILDFRFLKYSDGQYFKPHFDGTYTRPDGSETSYITIQVVDWSQCWCYSLPLKNVIKQICHPIGEVRAHVGLVGPVGLVGLVVFEGLVGLILGIFLLCNLTQKHFQMEIMSLMTQKKLMIPKSLMF